MLKGQAIFVGSRSGHWEGGTTENPRTNPKRNFDFDFLLINETPTPPQQNVLRKTAKDVRRDGP